MSGILYFLVALLIFGLIVFAHEMGHYLVARASGIRVLEFAIGFGPKLFGWRRKEIDYSVRVLPLGGYCKFEGETESSDDPRAFSNVRVWKRFLTVLAGPVMNFVLAYAAIAVFLMFFGVIQTVPVIGEISSGMPAETSGLQIGDVVTSVNGQPIEKSPEGAALLVQLIGESDPDVPVALAVDRGGQAVDVPITPQKTADGGKIGITLGYETLRYAPGTALVQSGVKLYDITRMMLDGLKNLVTRGEGIQDTMGPVGIISFMTQEISRSLDTIVNLIVVISLNLGILNLLPILPLDGGRLLFLTIEAVFRKPVKPRYEIWVQAAGILLLLAVTLYSSYRDIVRLVTGG